MKQKFIDRDLSWLSFNERVLQEAEDPSVPLFERLKFLAIFSSNLDEFYKVRVSKLRQFKKFQKDIRRKFFERPKKLIKDIQKEVNEHQERFGNVYFADILPRLEKERIFLIEEKEFTPEHHEFSKKFFKEHVTEHIKVYDLENDYDSIFLNNNGLFLFLKNEKNHLIYIPSQELGRFVVLPSEEGNFYVTYLDEIVRDNLISINSDFKDVNSYCIKITRDAELYYDEYDGEIVELIKEHLDKREKGIPTRLLYDFSVPKENLKSLRKQLSLNKTDLMPGGRYHNFSDFFNFPFPAEKTHLFYEEKPPLIHSELEKANSLIEHIKNQEELLCFPYQKFDYLPKLLQEAAKSEAIHSINITLYRTSSDSSIAEALLECLNKGKKVFVFIEVKARFDEENNIKWGEVLKEHGATILYSMPDIKVHSKIFLLEGYGFNIAYIGTGNFNAQSAKVYADFGLLTSSSKITTDLKKVIFFLRNPKGELPKVENIWMSPFNTRSSIYEKIDREINFAKNKKPASLIFKMNSLEDEGVINKLYEASQAGVEVKLIVRGIFRLLPQVKDLSENIEAVSIVGRYLEHARIYYFSNNGNEELYIASADCMTRNLDRRVEVAAPIFDSNLKAILKKCIDLQWRDNTKARILDSDQTNQYQENDFEPINSQMDFYRFLISKEGIGSKTHN